MEVQPSYTVVKCNACKEENKLYLMDLACTFVCSKCRRVHTRTGLDKWNDKEPFSKLLHTFSIALHSLAKIDGYIYRITACLTSRDHEGYSWREYWAFHPLKGYIYLSEFNGHWVKIKEVPGEFEHSFKSMEFFEGTYLYKKFSSFRFKYIGMEGELPFEISKSFSKTEEFIAPPFFIASEKSEDGISYFRGEHMTIDEVKEWMGSALVKTPSKTGVGMVEPYRGFMSIADVIALSVLAGVMILLVSLFYFITIPNKDIYEVTHYEGGGASDTVVSEVIEIGRKQNLQFELESSLFNNWAGVSIDVMNVETGEVISVYGETEFYSGYDGGEHWTEGSRNTDFMISSVPAGKYRFEVVFCRGSAGYSYISLKIKQGVRILRNLLVILIVIAAFPALLVWFSRSFEISRWSNSNYSPYHEDE